MALEKDWVVVLCQGNKSLLTSINSRMRRIDLFCKLMAPALFGVVTQFLGDTPEQKIRYGASWVLGWNVLGVFIEYSTVKRCYNANPILATQALKGQQDTSIAAAAEHKANNYGAVKVEDPDIEQPDGDVSRNLRVNEGPKPVDSAERGLLNSNPVKPPKKENNFSLEFKHFHCLCISPFLFSLKIPPIYFVLNPNTQPK